MQSSLKAGLHYFAIVFVAGFILGALRVTTIAPWLGETAAVAFELPFMLLISWIASRISVDMKSLVVSRQGLRCDWWRSQP